MEVMYISTVYTKLGFWLRSFVTTLVTTMCSTSCKKRWLLLDALLLVHPGKSGSLLCGSKELDFLLHLPTFSGAYPS